MVGYMLGNGARTVLVENASRFARDLIVLIHGTEAGGRSRLASF
jgi:hypothetical protein